MKPKLLIIADTYYPKVDGTIKFIEQFISKSEDKFNISLLVPFFGNKKGKNVNFVNTSRLIKFSGYKSVKISLRNMFKVKKNIKNSEIVFVQGPGILSLYSTFVGRKYKKVTISYIHTLSWELVEKFIPKLFRKILYKILRKLFVISYNRCSAVFVPYEELRRELLNNGVKVPIVVNKLGVDINKFYPSEKKSIEKIRNNINPGSFVIGYVGRISKEKNTSILLNAFKKLRDQRNLHLLMVGDGSESIEFKKLKNCTVTGFVNNVYDYLRVMDVFVMPSLTETTSLATLEAMATGLPVIVTKVGYMKRYVVKNYNGLFFPRNSSSVLALKIESLRNDNELRAYLGINARRKIVYSFSWERSINRIVRNLLKFYYET